MAEKAQQSSDKQDKKRKHDHGGNGAQKKTKVEEHRAIFVQPPNLADGCVLKDYQLEGVRWLASLFENGVSGILASVSV